MCPLSAARGAWVLLALSALGLAWQAKRYARGSPAARLALLGWAAWLGGLAWALAAGWVDRSAGAGALAGAGLLLLALTAWVVWRDWRAATQARRAAEEAIDRQMQAELQQVFDAHSARRDEP
ncbi:MAG: hypothetical protein GXO37_00140 [Chloroflexi bacterium]|nr:hypothetical protein [Chloroflexota bacterium]